MIERVLYRFLGDLVERQTLELSFLSFQLLREMPANGFAFAIGVGRDVDLSRLSRRPSVL